MPLAKDSDGTRSLLCTIWHVPDWSVSEVASCRLDFGNFPDRGSEAARSGAPCRSGLRDDEVLGYLCAIFVPGEANRPVKKARSRGRGDCGLVGFAGRVFIGACAPQTKDALSTAEEEQAQTVLRALMTSWTEVEPSGLVREQAGRVLRLHPAGSRCAEWPQPGVVSGRSRSPYPYLSRRTVTGSSSTRGVSYPSTQVVVSVPA